MTFINGSWTGSLPFTVYMKTIGASVIDYWEGSEKLSRFNNAIENALNN